MPVLTRSSEPLALMFADDGSIPNNPRLPLLVYRGAIDLTGTPDPERVVERAFADHGWGDMWRNGIYPYVHYHSMIHEALGIARGSAKLRLGGNKGRTVMASAGDVVVVPAGVGHECLTASSTFLVVGAYPPTGTYNECRGSFQEHDRAIAFIRRVGTPKQHPLYGSREPLW